MVRQFFVSSDILFWVFVADVAELDLKYRRKVWDGEKNGRVEEGEAMVRWRERMSFGVGLT